MALGGALSAPTNPAQIIFVEKSLAPLLPFFEISTQFLEKERFSLLTPVMMDLTDITTTIVIHFGLIYSTFFNYGSLLLSLHNAGTPKTRPQVQAVEPVKTVAIVPVSPGQIRERNDRKEAKKTDSVLWRWGRKSGASWLGA